MMPSATNPANLTAPVLNAVSTQLVGGRGRTPGSNSAEAPLGPPPTPKTLVCSGLLVAEVDEIAAAFEPNGLTERERRHDGDWAALLLRAG